MKRVIPLLLALLMLLSACGGEEKLPAPEPESGPSSAPSSSPAPGSAPTPVSDPAPDPAPARELLPGKVVSIPDAAEVFSAGYVVKGVQADLDRWEAAVRDPALAWLELSEPGLGEGELPVEEERELLALLEGARLGLYGPEEELPYPRTGGSWTLLGYDGEGKILFRAHFLGNLLYAQLGDEEEEYVFDGEAILPEALPLSSLPVSEVSSPADPDGPSIGIYAPAVGADRARRQQVDAMEAWLLANLDDWYYAGIQKLYMENGSIEITTSFLDQVKAVVEKYTGEAVPIEYGPSAYSIGQIRKAVEDMERFLEENPDVRIERLLEMPWCNGVWVETLEENQKLRDFVEGYSIQGVYQLRVDPEGEFEHPD